MGGRREGEALPPLCLQGALSNETTDILCLSTLFVLGTEDTTQYMEENTLAFACWLHFFVETRRGWLVAPRRYPDEEPLSLFVLLYDDLGVVALSSQAAFRPGGVCALDRPVAIPATDAQRDTFVRMDFEVLEADRASLLPLLDGCRDVCAAFVAHASLALVLRVQATAAAAERAIASWTTAPDFHAAAIVGAAGWCASESDTAKALRLAAHGTCRSAHVMPPGWDPEQHRVHMRGAGDMAAFIISQMTLAELGVARSDGRAGCLRGWQDDECMELFDARAAAAVRRALFETYLLLTGGDFDFDKRCAELGISPHEYPEAAAIVHGSITPRHRNEQLTKNNLTRKIVAMGGTSWSLDVDTVRG